MAGNRFFALSMHRVKDNYRPWIVDIRSFPEKGKLEDQLKFLLRFAILAPSGHNSQPWEFSVRDNSVSININQKRALSQSDPEGRQLLISIGCAIENLIIAADYYGFRTDVSYFPSASDKNLVAKVLFQKTDGVRSAEGHLIFSIPKRATNRSAYKNQTPPRDFLEKLNRFSNQDFKVSVVIDRDIRHKISDLANAAQIEAMESNAFREELSHYIKSSFTSEKFGMPGFTLGIPAPISLIASRLIKKINMSKKTKKQDDALLKKSTPAFVVISSTSDDRIHWARTGRLLEKIWLIAESEGLCCAPLAAVAQLDEFSNKLRNVLHIEQRPQAFLRLGYCSRRARHSPRLSLEDVII